MISYISQYTNRSYYTLEHPEIKLTSSNRSKVEAFEQELYDVTLNDIKQNKIPNRYSLLRELYCAGNNELFIELLRLRNNRNILAKNLLDNNVKKINQDVLKKTKIFQRSH